MFLNLVLNLINSLLQSVLVILPVLICVAYFILLERKVIGAIQLRRGPNVVGPFGLLQALADGLKLFLKENIIPNNANTIIFVLAPIATFTLSLVGWAVVPFGEGLVYSDINVGLLYLLAISSLGVYGLIIAGWASNSRYAFLGALRSSAQMVSYEVAIGFILIIVILGVGSLNLTQVVLAQEAVWFIFPFFPLFLMFFISSLAETNRTPFDLPEAEGELVAGYFVEYSAMGFALFFLGEMANIILMASFSVIFFLGGWLPPVDLVVFNWVPGVVWFGLKLCFILFSFIWVRAAYPRYRYDQLMHIGWKILLPLTLGWIFFFVGIMQSLGILFFY